MKTLIIVLLLLSTSLSAQSPRTAVGVKLDLKVLNLAAVRLDSQMTIPTLWADSLGDPELFGKDYPEQYVRQNLTPSEKRLRLDRDLIDSIGAVAVVQIELRHSLRGGVEIIGGRIPERIYYKMGYVLSSGEVTDLYGNHPFLCTGVRPQSYWLAVHFVNGFTSMTSDTVVVPPSPGRTIHWDWTTGQDKFYLNSGYPVYQTSLFATMTADLNEDAIIDMGDLSIFNNNYTYDTLYSRSDLDNSGAITSIDWAFLVNHLGIVSPVPSTWRAAPRIFGVDNIETYELRADNFQRQNNEFTFDIRMRRTGERPIDVGLEQFVFNKTAEIHFEEISYTSTAFDSVVVRETDSTWIFLGVPKQSGQYDLPVEFTKQISIRASGITNNISWRANSNPFTKISTRRNGLYVDITDPQQHVVDFLTSTSTSNSIVTNYKLFQNHPNPFNPTTTITFDIPKSGLVSLKVYDLLGREVTSLINEIQPQGEREVTFIADDLPSGVYYYKIQAGSFIDVKKMILIK